MSRGWAAVGAASGVAVGAVVGSEIASAWALKAIDPIDNNGFLIGALVGAAVGAAIGAGSSKPKQIAGVSGVGALPRDMGGGFVP